MHIFKEIEYEEEHYETVVTPFGGYESVLVPRQPRRQAWFELTFPWEEPKWGRGKLRWRRRHERIWWLERDLRLIRGGLGRCPMPWYR
jgi:hypothetical protein